MLRRAALLCLSALRLLHHATGRAIAGPARGRSGRSARADPERRSGRPSRRGAGCTDQRLVVRSARRRFCVPGGGAKRRRPYQRRRPGAERELDRGPAGGIRARRRARAGDEEPWPISTDLRRRGLRPAAASCRATFWRFSRPPLRRRRSANAKPPSSIACRLVSAARRRRERPFAGGGPVAEHRSATPSSD